MDLLNHSPIGPISGDDYKKFYLLNTVNGCTALMHRELFVMAAPFCSDMPHDWWLVYVAALEGRLAHCSEHLWRVVCMLIYCGHHISR